MDLEVDSKVAFKLWNMDKYGYAQADLTITYVEPETEPTTPEESTTPEGTTTPEESTTPEEGSNPSEETPSDSSPSGGEAEVNQAPAKEKTSELDIEESAEDETI